MSQILCRLDLDENPLVFVADSYDDTKKSLLAWRPGSKKLDTIGIEYYKSTKPMQPDDAEALAKKYSQVMHDKNIVVRLRLPRMYRENKSTGMNNQESLTNVSDKPQIVTMPARAKRSAAAKKRYEQEIAQTAADAANGKTIDVNELAKRIAEALKPLF